MANFSRDLKKSLDKSRKKGKIKKVTNSQEARSAAENDNIVKTKAADLFSNIVDAYTRKIQTNKVLKIILFGASIAVLIAFVVAFIICLFVVIDSEVEIAELLAILIPAGVSVVTSVISIIVIIAKYLFPQKEDENFTELVKVLYKASKENDG